MICTGFPCCFVLGLEDGHIPTSWFLEVLASSGSCDGTTLDPQDLVIFLPPELEGLAPKPIGSWGQKGSSTWRSRALKTEATTIVMI